MFALWVLSLLPITLCDLELLVDAIGTRRERRTTDQPRPASADNWLMWIVAVVLSWFFFPVVASGVRVYRLHNRLDILLLDLGMTLVVVLFDAALSTLPKFCVHVPQRTSRLAHDPEACENSELNYPLCRICITSPSCTM